MTLRTLISTHHLSQRQAARILGINPRTMRRWCAGKDEPPPEVLARLTEHLRKTT